jgi:hypothetical protein
MYQDPTLYQGTSRCPDIDPEYMPFERFGNIIVGSTQCGNLGWELEPQVLAVWRAVVSCVL